MAPPHAQHLCISCQPLIDCTVWLYCCEVGDYITDCAIYQNVMAEFSLPTSLLLPCRVKGCWSKEGGWSTTTSPSMQTSTSRMGSSSAYIRKQWCQKILKTCKNLDLQSMTIPLSLPHPFLHFSIVPALLPPTCLRMHIVLWQAGGGESGRTRRGQGDRG